MATSECLPSDPCCFGSRVVPFYRPETRTHRGPGTRGSLKIINPSVATSRASLRRPVRKVSWIPGCGTTRKQRYKGEAQATSTKERHHTEAYGRQVPTVTAPTTDLTDVDSLHPQVVDYTRLSHWCVTCMAGYQPYPLRVRAVTST